MALDILLIVLGYLLAAVSGVLWSRKIRRDAWGGDVPAPGWQSTALLVLAIAVAGDGGSNLQVHQHWDARWLAVAVIFPIAVTANVVPRIVRWLQLRRSATHPSDPNGPVGVPPAV